MADPHAQQQSRVGGAGGQATAAGIKQGRGGPRCGERPPRETKGGGDDGTSNVHSVQELNGQSCKGTGKSGQARDGSLHVFHQYRADCRVCREKGTARKTAPALARSTVSRSCHDWTGDQNPRRRSREGHREGDKPTAGKMIVARSKPSPPKYHLVW